MGFGLWYFDEPIKIAKIRDILKRLRNYIRNTYPERKHKISGDLDFTGLTMFEFHRNLGEVYLSDDKGKTIVNLGDYLSAEGKFFDFAKPLRQGKQGLHWNDIAYFMTIPKDILLKFKYDCRILNCLDFFQFMLDEWEKQDKKVFTTTSLFNDENLKKRILMFDNYKLW